MGQGQNEGMKKTLLFALALIAVGCAEPIPDLGEVRVRADLVDPTAQYELGHMYADGEGVPQDDVLACMWWNLAAV